MSALLASYFEDLLNSFDDEGDQEVEVVHDNARLPTPAVGRLAMAYMSQDSSCHTRSTISTIASAGSTGSNSSTGSCRWDSNPSSGNKEKSDQLKRPQRPGRKNSDSNINNSNSSKDRSSSYKDDKPVERPRRTSSDSHKRKKSDKPRRPSRTSSNEKRESDGSAETLDKILLQNSKQKAVDSDSSSENSLKEIFRSSRRTPGPAHVNPLPGTRTSPTRSVGEILGQSMEELKLAW